MKKKKSKKYVKKPKNFVKIKEEAKTSNYNIRHARHGCYEVILHRDEKMIYLTNFRNKKAAEKFIEAHKNGEVSIDPETCIPTPDFK
ncbi:hypothetical protein CMI47_16250 [Candidatus Pacearchaeota archaeon]|nr:hypothetical protein [Candidatus Pacearchaeota archaeon]|tara:strand:+ start:7 stop:267 length:261 start_codon:yes stop_codon:yes gene_type:complete